MKNVPDSCALKHVQEWSVVVLAVVLPLGQTPAEAALIIGLLAWAARLIAAKRRPALRRNPLAPGWEPASWRI